MARLQWGEFGSRRYETGVDRGVIYPIEPVLRDWPQGAIIPAVPWNGLTSYSETPQGVEPIPVYQDGIKLEEVPTQEVYAGTVAAFTAPEYVEQASGRNVPQIGVQMHGGYHGLFNFTCRTKLENDLGEPASSYIIHLIYNVTGVQTARQRPTRGQQDSPLIYTYNLSSVPEIVEGYAPVSSISIVANEASEDYVRRLEELLYGTAETEPSFPSPQTVLAIFEGAPLLLIVDHGDGSFTASSPSDMVRMTDSETFELDAPTVIILSEDEYQVSDYL